MCQEARQSSPIRRLTDTCPPSFAAGVPAPGELELDIISNFFQRALLSLLSLSSPQDFRLAAGRVLISTPYFSSGASVLVWLGCN